MQIKTIDATATQLADFAIKNLGIDITFRAGSDKIRAALLAAGYEKGTIEIDDPEGDRPYAEKIFGPIPDVRMVTIIIPQSPGAGGKDPVPVSVNGRAMLIPRARAVEIPYSYYGALRDAVQYDYEPLSGGGMSEPSRVPTYPFSVISGI